MYIPYYVRRHWLTIAFVAGFVTDVILLNQVEDFLDNLILLFYVVLATISLIGLYIGVAHRAGESFSRFLRKYCPVSLQYAFGGLLSGMLIFYGRSGDWLASWPFLILIAVAILGNEIVKDRSQRLVFTLSIYFIGLFSYVVLVVSVFSGRTEPWVFYVSGFSALVFVYVLIQIIAAIIPQYARLQMRNLVFSIGCLYVGLNALYLTSVLPPIPLSLKEITIAHSVVRYPELRQYDIQYEPIPWWNVVERWRPTLHLNNSTSAACFTNVFAPTRITTEIYHQWDYFDPNQNKWVERFRIPYQISGEATQGYRGFSASDNVVTGTWRCSVKNTRGQALGHKVFYVDTRAVPAELARRID
jgi:hypothetical protein